MNFKIYSRALIKNVGVIDWYSNQGIIFCQAKFLTFNVYWTVDSIVHIHKLVISGFIQNSRICGHQYTLKNSNIMI
jgi:hypothetical protein